MSSIRSNLSAISHHHQLNGHQNPTDNFLVDSLLSSYEKHDPPPAIREAITRDILERMITSIRAQESGHTRTLFCTMLIFMYQGLLRCSEVSITGGASHNLMKYQISIPTDNPTQVKIAFESYKHSKPAPPPIFLSQSEGKLCPVKAFIKYAHSPNRSKYFFAHKSGMPVMRAQLVDMIKKHISLIGLNEDHYNTHSLRMGKATDMADQGFSYSQIRAAGRWTSNAFLKYIKPKQVVIL